MSRSADLLISVRSRSFLLARHVETEACRVLFGDGAELDSNHHFNYVIKLMSYLSPALTATILLWRAQPQRLNHDQLNDMRAWVTSLIDRP